MKKVLAVALLVGMVVAVAQPVLAVMNPYANYALDMQARNAKRVCPIAYSSCSVINQVRPTLGSMDAIVVLYRYTGVTVAEFGLVWDSYQLLFVQFKKCTVTSVEGGNTLYGHYAFSGAWETCQMAVNPYPGDSGIAVGWVQFDQYPGGVIGSRVDYYIEPGWGIRVADCNYTWDDMHTLHAGFIGTIAPEPTDLAPCLQGPTATQPTTWSGVKALYR
jgi:hypothetical protein